MNNKKQQHSTHPSKTPVIIVTISAIILSILTLLSALQYLGYGPASWFEKPDDQAVATITRQDQSTLSRSEHIAANQNRDQSAGQHHDPAVTPSATPPIQRPPRQVFKADIDYPKLDNRTASLGINTNEINEEDASIPFVDLFKAAAPFKEKATCPAEERPCLSTPDVIYNDQGWPVDLKGGRAGTKFIGKMPPAAIPKGEYVVLYDGNGQLEYGHDVKVVRQAPGRDIITFDNDEDGEINGSLFITQTDRFDPIRNINILMPGGICQKAPFKHVDSADECTTSNYLSYEKYHQSILFNPDYLNFMKDFSVIRFMPMSGITRNNEKHWHERPSWKEASWGGTYGSRGAPLEVMITLANRLNADAWFNIPHAATDDYTRRYGEMVKKHLKPQLRVYIEYTNEAWNTNFIHAEYTQKRGIELGLDSNALEAGYKFYTKRSIEVFDIWQDIFNDDERLIRVLGGWDTRTDISKKLLSYNEAYKHADVIAVAPYVGGNTRGFRESSNVDQIFDLLFDPRSYRSLPEMMIHIKEQAHIAKDFGVRLIAYEGGQGLVDWATREPDQHPNPLFFEANRDERMKRLYADLLEGWRDAGGDLFVAFSAPRTCQWFGCWGLKEHIRMPRDESPKYDSVLDFMAVNPRWWNVAEKVSKPLEVRQVKGIDPAKPRIVIRPARGDASQFHRLLNPRTLDVILDGESWVKKDLSGKWEAKWDEQNLYLTVKVFDDKLVVDSDNPNQDDSVGFYIDADNSRHSEYDRINDFGFLFTWNKQKIEVSSNSPGAVNTDAIDVSWEKKEDGYELHASIPWDILRVTPKISNRIGIEVVVNDDDDGGERDGKIAWVSRKDGAANADRNPRQFGVVLISGR